MARTAGIEWWSRHAGCGGQSQRIFPKDGDPLCPNVKPIDESWTKRDVYPIFPQEEKSHLKPTVSRPRPRCSAISFSGPERRKKLKISLYSVKALYTQKMWNLYKKKCIQKDCNIAKHHKIALFFNLVQQSFKILSFFLNAPVPLTSCRSRLNKSITADPFF